MSPTSLYALSVYIQVCYFIYVLLYSFLEQEELLCSLHVFQIVSTGQVPFFFFLIDFHTYNLISEQLPVILSPRIKQ